MRCFALVIVGLLLSCQKDPSLVNVCADPLGSQDIIMKHNNLICFKEKFNACFTLKLTSTSQTLIAVDYNSIYPGTMIGMMADGGSIRCLGEVVTKPTTGFFYGFNIVPNRGYIVKLPDNTYGRLYVDSWVKSSSGTVSEVHITWQYSF